MQNTKRLSDKDSLFSYYVSISVGKISIKVSVLEQSEIWIFSDIFFFLPVYMKLQIIEVSGIVNKIAVLPIKACSNSVIIISRFNSSVKETA